MQAKREAQNNLDRSADGIAKIIEDAKFDLFKKLMDQFVEERKQLEKKHSQTQTLLAQAAKVGDMIAIVGFEILSSYGPTGICSAVL